MHRPAISLLRMVLRRGTPVLAICLLPSAAASAQHAGHGNSADSAGAARTRQPAALPRPVGFAAHAVPLFTRATPTAQRRSLAEAYLSQAALMAMGRAAGGRVDGIVMLNLEGLTLERGELTTGTYGEGYVDRRHPHAFLHEAVVSVRTAPGSLRALSLSAGRGFATFGSDDPMVRPFVKYPVNHHLAQVLERAIIAGAARRGIVGIEVSLFNGDEPGRASDLPTWSRFADSWAARVTVYPRDGTELSVSRAFVASPEVRAGFGVDARKWHVAARVAGDAVYGLAEWARTTDDDDGHAGRSYDSFLGEGALSKGAATVALRVERTDRHEEERLDDPFRVAPSTGEGHVLAVTRWTTVTLALSRRLTMWRGVHLSPFVEGAASRPRLLSGLAFDPRAFYGATTLAMLSAGARVSAGRWHTRMGRYGVAVTSSHTHH